jgi:hypothetical protein
MFSYSDLKCDVVNAIKTNMFLYGREYFYYLSVSSIPDWKLKCDRFKNKIKLKKTVLYRSAMKNIFLDVLFT